jgi:two-component system, chemotaxis family, chemotaxis protein CheY
MQSGRMSSLPKIQFNVYRALIVDPEPNMRRLVREMLRYIGLTEHQFAVDSHQALHFLESAPFDVLVVSLDLPGESGFEFSRRMRTSKKLFDPGMPIVAYGEILSQDNVNKARDCGIDELMSKPLSTVAMAKRLAAVLAGRREFVRTEAYIGPDRRRRRAANFSGPWRREADRLAAQARREELVRIETEARAKADAVAAQERAEAEARKRTAEGNSRADAEARARADAALAAKTPDLGAMSQEELARWLRAKKAQAARPPENE